MRFFKNRTVNWKYIFGEVFLIFIGINLAIWFNDWNTSKTVQKDKEIALVKIKEEINNNLQELERTRAHNQKVPLFYKGLEGIKNQNEEVRVSPEKMRAFVTEYSEFFINVDSIPLGNGLYEYEGDTFVNIEITDLSSIAWEISKSTGIFHEFGYDCLYDLQGLYNLQDLVKNELTKATEALRDNSIEDLVRVMGFMDQLEEQLIAQYTRMIDNIDNCK
ncbi:hypothetical protein [Flagellimonas allohymeniacidonis]|uniref:Uncharacterized protein n=1 Tax=Flagellimonas allohymeniacidonis TaxID=2517819 RepID=A0A4Q8QHJ9_9FLAO|nr:hypothetical protein [Allomuricauda hymeniacidonis]TAI48113.1 hypothetical protein EW142_15820 [Allomuricauda hymeniacidonis]